MLEDNLTVRRQRYVAGLLIRVIVCAIFIGVFAVTASVVAPSARAPFVPASLSLLILIAVNYPFWLVGKALDFPLEHFYGHWLVDLYLVTLILHTLGGVDLPCGFGAYLIMIVTSAVFLSGRAAVVVATGSVLWFDGLVFFEAAGILSHQAGVWDHHYTKAAQVIVVLAADVFFYLFAFVVGSLSQELKAANVKLGEARDELARYSHGLEQNVRLRTVALEQKNREVEEFVHIVTHDLRNASTGVVELARRLLDMDAGRLSERGLKYATHLRDDTRLLNQMLTHLLSLFKADYDAVKLETLDMNTLVASIVSANTRRLEEKHISVEVGDLPVIVGDRLLVNHVVGNLIDNAIKYSGDKPTPRIEIMCTDEGVAYRLIVKDNGIGIPERQKQRIFQLYQRGTEQRVGGVMQKGEGIGLAIARRIVERWGGRMEVESTIGVGATFHFTLPKTVGTALNGGLDFQRRLGDS
jgi:signal transduction histidine kinase